MRMIVAMNDISICKKLRQYFEEYPYDITWEYVKTIEEFDKKILEIRYDFILTEIILQKDDMYTYLKNHVITDHYKPCILFILDDAEDVFKVNPIRPISVLRREFNRIDFYAALEVCREYFESHLEYIIITENYVDIRICKNQIVCIYKQNRKTVIQMKCGDCHETYLSIRDILKGLGENFIQVSQSAIINKKRIKEWIRNKRSVEMENKMTFKFSDHYWRLLLGQER